MPGIYHPEQILHKLREMWDAKLLHIDWWEGDVDDSDEFGQIYFVSPFMPTERLVSGPWFGVCGQLTDNGCALSEEERPYQCLALVPMEVYSEKGNCTQKVSKKDMAKLWREHQATLIELVEEYYNND